MCKIHFYATLALGLLIAWLFLGILLVEQEQDSFQYFFVKQSPTFRVVFTNPYASDPTGEEFDYRKRMDDNGNWLPDTPELNEYLAYCKARYGIESTDPIAARTECRAVKAVSK